MKLKVASYNIHKAVGLDRQRDPDRIMTILREIDADVIALQEADRRFGLREAVIPRATLDDHSPWRAVEPGHYDRARTGASMGWHGNALLVRREIEVVEACAVPLPTIEPRGAVCATLRMGGALVRVVGTLSALVGMKAVSIAVVRASASHPIRWSRITMWASLVSGTVLLVMAWLMIWTDGDIGIAGKYRLLVLYFRLHGVPPL